MKLLCWVLTVEMLVVILTAAAYAEEPATVRATVESGPELRAFVDARTDDEHLWLRFGGGTTVVLRRIAWDKIDRLEHEGQSITRAQALQLATPHQAHEPARPQDGPEIESLQAREWLGFQPRVQFVQFEAFFANWDGDVEADGLWLRLQPLTARGQLLPVAGTVHVELTALRQVKSHQVPSSSSGLTHRKLGRWTRQLAARDFGPDGADLQLPFQAGHPEFDTRWASKGLVHVRFVVPGQGVFEDSQDGVALRPVSPLRDFLETTTGKRFLPSERTGR